MKQLHVCRSSLQKSKKCVCRKNPSSEADLFVRFFCGFLETADALAQFGGGCPPPKISRRRRGSPIPFEFRSAIAAMNHSPFGIGYMAAPFGVAMFEASEWFMPCTGAPAGATGTGLYSLL